MKATATAKTLDGILTFYWRYDMNERMKQIAERCGLYGVKDYDNTISEDVSKVRLDKFTELIVKECMESLWTEECHTSDLAAEDYNRNCSKIKQHFGIGEVE